jgi:hypothetical protein
MKLTVFSVSAFEANVASSNAFVFPVIHLSYPETAHRSLRRKDNVFHKTKLISIVMKRAKEEPDDIERMESCRSTMKRRKSTKEGRVG